MVLLKPGLLISSHVREGIKSRPLQISTIVVWTRNNEIPQTFSEEWSNYQLSSIRILPVVQPSWFCRFERAFSGHFRLRFLEFALQTKKVTNPNKIASFETSKCLL